jgi:heme-degrading monooxygenase HmoA
MCAVVGAANLDPARAEEAITVARNILAKVSEAPGFVSGVFTRSSDGKAGRSMRVFETEEAAQAVAERASSMLPEGGPTEIVSLDVFEVVDRR